MVATHPEDHSVDVVMADNGDRLTGIQVLSWNGSERSGTVDMPDVPTKKDKWDITEKTGQERKAVIGFVGRNPVVVGFLYPQINQILQSDPKLAYSRHQSDVEYSVDGNGNIQLSHPSGAYIRIGEETDKQVHAGKNFDGNAVINRNVDKKVNVHVALAGKKVELTLSKDGNVTLNLKGDLKITGDGKIDIEADEKITIKSASEISFKAPKVNANKGI